MSKFIVSFIVMSVFFIFNPSVKADEGMWTLDHFPSDKVQKSYGFSPNQAWLDHVRQSAVRLAGGCSGGFVSSQGLVQTNHHCARECIDDIGEDGHDYGLTGFYAPNLSDEKKCPTTEINQLILITDVTSRITEATRQFKGSAYSDALKAEKARIAKDCSGNDDHFRCDVVELYHGGQFHLYRYRRYQDVRLVFVPEQSIAFFGGDPDNFEFPRFDLDVSYMRVYEEGKPLNTEANYFPYAKENVKEGDLVFTIGHPGSTNRLNTAEDLEFQRDVVLPQRLFYLSEIRGILTEYVSLGDEQSRIANSLLFGVENSLKALKGKLLALTDSKIIADRRQSDQLLLKKVKANKELAMTYGQAWDNIHTALDYYKTKRNRYIYLEGLMGFRSQLFSQARSIIRYSQESQKPDTERLSEYTDSNFPALKQSLLSNAPIYPDLEKLTLTFSLTKLRETLGPDDDFVKKLFGKQSPAQLANDLINQTTLSDSENRKKLLEAGPDAIKNSKDPMILLALRVDPEMRAIRKLYEDEIDSVLKKNYGSIAKAAFTINGANSYPDATFSLRLSYGTIKGYPQGDRFITPLTFLGGTYDRATGAPPFDLPESWLKGQQAINPKIPFNIASTNDIIGGNSGSPLINQKAEAVGLIFDGNRQSLGGDYGYDMTANRAVSVSTAALAEALDKIYGATRIVNELKKH